MHRYTYGDTPVAAERLSLLADVFDDASAAFLRDAAPTSTGLAVDVGCGPGRTTTLVHAVTGASRTVGLDRSPAFVARARSLDVTGTSFLVHDAREVPFPVGPADLVFARLLLAHLPDPVGVATRWSTMLTIGGRLLIDEIDAIATDIAPLATYLEDVAVPVVRRGGGSLLLGGTLHAADDPAGTRRVIDRAVHVEVPAATAARIFALNLDVLVAGEEVVPPAGLAAALAEIAAGCGHQPAVTWSVRQIAWERVDASDLR